MTPEFPEGMTAEQGINHLYNHSMVFPGRVANDKPVFDRAQRYASSRQWNTNVVVARRPVAKKEQADLLARLQQLAGISPGEHGIYYSFPLSDAVEGQFFVDAPGPNGSIIKGEMQGNCATFPRFVDVLLPESSGNLRKYMPALEAEASAAGN